MDTEHRVGMYEFQFELGTIHPWHGEPRSY
jgi:hypothetical protein